MYGDWWEDALKGLLVLGILIGLAMAVVIWFVIWLLGHLRLEWI